MIPAGPPGASQPPEKTKSQPGNAAEGSRGRGKCRNMLAWTAFATQLTWPQLALRPPRAVVGRALEILKARRVRKKNRGANRSARVFCRAAGPRREGGDHRRRLDRRERPDLCLHLNDETRVEALSITKPRCLKRRQADARREEAKRVNYKRSGSAENAL